MRRSLTSPLSISLLAVAVVAAALAVPAGAAAPAADLQPQRLDRGADIAVPHVEDGPYGEVFVDGARRVELPGQVARIVGPSDDAWLVATGNVDRNRNRRVVRVEADGSVTDVLRNIETSTVIVSADGSTLAWQQYVSRGRKVLTHVASATDGTDLGTRGPTRYEDLLAVDPKKVVLGSDTRTFAWNHSRNATRTRTIAGGMAAGVDLPLRLLSSWTKHPYDGGCYVLRRLGSRVKLWSSCRERVAAFSPDGTQMLTFHKLTDGLGPGEITLRTIRGKRLATWTTGWFSGWEWESPGIVLLEANGKRRSATVRCDLGACENATDPVKVQVP